MHDSKLEPMGVHTLLVREGIELQHNRFHLCLLQVSKNDHHLASYLKQVHLPFQSLW
jgi:hypothetical protein